MPPPGPPRRIDERVLGAGTSVRFVTLLFLLLTACGSMMLTVLRGLAHGDQEGCNLAAGVDPDDGGYWAPIVAVSGQTFAYRLCTSIWAPAPPWWQVVGWPVLLTVAAALLFLLLPLRKARRGRVVPLESADPEGELRSLIDELAAVTGLAPMPRIVVDPATASVNAVVFGRTGRPVVCLDGGLLATRRTDPERFRAVLLHEFAHIANRDVTLTYLTVALWRVFLVLILLPYLLWEGHVVQGVLADGAVPRPDRAMLLAAVLVLLVHLARADTLRSREVWADVTALRWGADPRGWAAPAAPPGGPLRRALGPFLELWRTHPRSGLRQGALTDPAPLFRVSVLPLLLLGTVPVVTPTHLLRQLAPYRVDSSTNVLVAIVLVPAVLVTGVAGVALWRAVAYAVLTGGRVPSGWWAGAWLGAGMAAGSILNGDGVGWAWLPQRPAVLLVPVLAGAAFGWWITQCALLWAGTWRGRTLRPALLVSLSAGCLAMVSWLTWWLLMGVAYAGGFTVRADAMVRTVQRWFPSAAPSGDLGRLPGLTTVLPLLETVTGTPLIALTVTALWVVPLLGWAAGPAGGAPRWFSAAFPAPAEESGGPGGPPPPRVAPLRAVLLPGLLGGVLACLAVAGLQACLHTGQPGPDARGGLYALRYALLLPAVVVVPAALAGAAAGARAGRLRLLGSLVAAQVAALLGLVAAAVLVSADGCVAPLNVLSDDCAWRPVWRRPLFPYLFVLNNTLTLAAAAAVLAALAVSTAAAARAVRATRRVRRRPAGGSGTDTGTGTGTGTSSDSDSDDGRTGRRGRLAVALLCVVAVGGASATAGHQMYQAGLVTDVTANQRDYVQRFGLPYAPVSEPTRQNQVHAWYHLGGYRFIELAASYSDGLTAAGKGSSGPESWDALDGRFRAACTRWRDAGTFELAWFRVPDQIVQADWHAMIVRADRGSRGCAQALDAHDSAGLLNALRDLLAAGRCAASANARIDAVLRAGHYRGTYRTPAGGAGAACEHVGQ
ncbi:hypothetical protein GCM10018781_22400 [Kitasatospora indigofera]|uniref:Peptidase M48 domain-containing protein n=1 Tax=Kitasatospora indigofera TaxID=67307 RepID=A0A919KP24_9ACTN|nr:M48 family metalloprotease [Kitasatospora indigofera]GHH67323.1 hypothetical protein GCM10018781_22400 [Kitasatospora indigofera]